MTPKIKIGSHYEPRHFTHRTPTTFSAKMPATTPDGERIQSAFMVDHARQQRELAFGRPHSSTRIILATLAVALLYGAWVASQIGG